MQQESTSTSRRSLSSLLLGISNVSETLLPMARGVVLARLLAPDQFGVAITVTIVASVAELISDLGVAQTAIRSGLGTNLGTLHSLAAIRGVILGCVIALCGPFFAVVFKTPETAWIYSVAGLASAIRGFTHLEVAARMRQYQYTPEAVTIVSGQLIWTVASIGVALITPDYRAMAAGLLMSTIGSVLVSHLMSSTRFRLQWDRHVVAEALAYGRPLALNGIALAVASLGDRFLIGWRVGVSPLAQYTALTSAAFMPRSAVSKFMVALFTPQFMNATTGDDQRKLANIWILTLATLGGAFGLAFIACGQMLVTLVFGTKYVIAQDLINLIGFLACIRYMAITPVSPSLALGRTDVVLRNTASAASGLMIAALLLLYFPSLNVLISGMILGEGLALLWILYHLRKFVTFTPMVLWTSVLAPNALIAFVITFLIERPDLANLERIELCCAALLAHFGCQIVLLRVSGANLTDIAHRLFPRHSNLAASQP